MSFHTKGATYSRQVLDLMFQNKHITEEQYQNMMECCSSYEEEYKEPLKEIINNISSSPSPSSRSYIWETFDSLFKTVYFQVKRIEDLDKRLKIAESRIERYLKPDFPK